MARRHLALVVALATMVAGCAGRADEASPATSSPAATIPAATGAAPPTSTTSAPVVPPATSAPAPTSPATPLPTEAPTVPATVPPTVPPPSTMPGVAGRVVDALAVRELGRSRQGRPITAVERGTPGGTPVLVVGVIHGDEDDGVAVLERLATAPVPPGIDLWLVESMNPDGQAAQQRGNAHGVDLNRNFPHEWGPIGEPGDGQYAGTGPASEPETQAMVDFVGEIRPALAIWYHQDLFRLSPGDGLEGRVKQRYADLTGLPVERITGGTYTGVAATWVRQAAAAVSFIVELGPTLPAAEADAHAAAVLDVAGIVAEG